MAAQRGHRFLFARQFFEVPAFERGPTLRVASEPFAEFVAGRNLFEPEVYLCFRLGQAARPEPVDEDAEAIAGRRFLVGALEDETRG